MCAQLAGPQTISAGSIIVLRIPSFNLEYDKFIVLITPSLDGSQMAAVCINTKPSPRENHIIIKQNEHSFLSYDSHIDCSSIIPFEKKWIEELLQKEPERFLGEISPAQYIDLILKIRASVTITADQRKRFNI